MTSVLITRGEDTQGDNDLWWWPRGDSTDASISEASQGLLAKNRS